MTEQSIDAHFMASIGTTTPRKKEFPLDDVTVVTVEETDEEDSGGTSDEESDSESSSNVSLSDEADVEAFFASAVHAGKLKGIDAETLSEVWRIDLETAKKTLDITSQNGNFADDTAFTKNQPTGDKMICCKCIKQLTMFLHGHLLCNLQWWQIFLWTHMCTDVCH